MHFAFEDNKQIILGMEYVGKISLNNYLKSKHERRVEENEARIIFSQIVEGIRYCHQQ